MTERVPGGAAVPQSEGDDPPVPADLPDQQIQEGEDPLDVPVPQRVKRQADASGDVSDDVPEPDESGAGRAEAEPSQDAAEHLTSDESTG